MTAAGWQPHTLDAAAKFLLSDPEHTTPRPARAYLITDADVARTAAQHNPNRPHIPTQPNDSPTTGPAEPPPPPTTDPPSPDRSAAGRAEDPDADADAVLWRLLCDAPDNGVTVAELVAATGMSRATVYRRLRGHAKNGQAITIGGGRWRSLRTR